MKRSRIQAKRGPKRKINSGTWVITAESGTVFDAGYYPHPKMAVGKMLDKYPHEKVKSVKFYSVAPFATVKV